MRRGRDSPRVTFQIGSRTRNWSLDLPWRALSTAGSTASWPAAPSLEGCGETACAPPKTPDPLSPAPWHRLSSGGCQVTAPWTVLGEILKLEPQHVTGADAVRAREPQNSPPGQQPLCGLRGVGLTSKSCFHPPRLGLIDSQGESCLYLGRGPISNFESSASL